MVLFEERLKVFADNNFVVLTTLQYMRGEFLLLMGFGALFGFAISAGLTGQDRGASFLPERPGVLMIWTLIGGLAGAVYGWSGYFDNFSKISVSNGSFILVYSHREVAGSCRESVGKYQLAGTRGNNVWRYWIMRGNDPRPSRSVRTTRDNAERVDRLLERCREEG